MSSVQTNAKQSMSSADFLLRHTLPVYFLLAYLITWVFSWVVKLAMPVAEESIVSLILAGLVMNLVVLAGPTLSAIIVTARTEGQAGLRGLFGNARVWRVAPAWYAFIFLYPLALHLLVTLIGQQVDGQPPTFFSAAYVGGTTWWFGLGVIALNLFRSVSEEFGWRGYALPRMQSRWGMLKASLLLGVLWGLWHFHPLNWEALKRIPLPFMLSLVATTVIFTWVYNHTRGSMLIAVLFHTSLNFAEWVIPAGLMEGDLMRFYVKVGLTWLFVAFLLLWESLAQRRVPSGV